MRVKFQDVECFREYEYDYVDDADGGATSNIGFTMWNPPSLDTIKKEEEKPKLKNKPAVADDYTDRLAAELGLRSMKNQSRGSVEEIDLSYFDYFDNVDTNISPALGEELNKNNTSLLNLSSQNETAVEVKTLNHSAIHLRNTSYSENTTYMWNSGAALTSDNSSVHDATNTSVSATVSPKSNSASANNSASDTENTSVRNTREILLAGNASTETSNLDLPLKGSSTPNVMSTGQSKEAYVDATLAEDSVEQLTRGDVFLYFPPSSNESAATFHNRNLTSSQSETVSPLNKNDSPISTADRNYSLNVATSSLEKVTDIWLEPPNVTANIATSSSSAEINWDSEEDATALLAQGDDTLVVKGGSTLASSNESATTFQNTSENTIPPFSKKGDKEDNQTEVDSQYRNSTSSQLETVSPPNKNVTANRATSNSSAEVSWDSDEDATALPTQGNETSVVKGPSDENPVSAVSGVSLVSDELMSSSQELGTSDSVEEVVIYLKENKTNPIKTTSVKVPMHNWTYEGTHQTETMEIPDYLLKYLGKEIPRLVSKPKRTKKVHLRHWPGKGQGMKTKRRKEYKPQPISSLPFSPRGFHPVMTPRGSRPTSVQPVSDEAELVNTPLVIGVPRPDFSDYELYVPGDDPEHLAQDDQNVNANEYEYVGYNDPYSSHEDVKNFHLDEKTQYFMKMSGPNTQVYFIAAEEVEWDYGGYGRK